MTLFHRLDFKFAVATSLVLMGLTSLAVTKAMAMSAHPILGSSLMQVGVVSVLAVGFGLWIARDLSQPVSRLAQDAGMLDHRTSADFVRDAARGDAAGAMARELGRLADAGQERTARERLSTYKSAAFQSCREAMMIVDADRNIVMANPGTQALFADNIDAFREIWSDLDPDKLVGRSIDAFHAKPDVQRRLLADPSRLPYETDISIGQLRFNMNVSAILDDDGVHIGNILEWKNVTKDRMNAGILGAIEVSQAVIEFDLDGTITAANSNFLATVGYERDEIIGRKHGIFIEADHAMSAEYVDFWSRLRRGETITGKFQRVAKNGRAVWLEAAYNAVKDTSGKPYKVVKIATDITDVEEARLQHEADLAEKAAMQSRVVSRLETAFRDLSEGNLDVEIKREFGASYESLREDFNATIATLRQAQRAQHIQEADLAKKAQAQQRVVDRLATGLRGLADGNLLSHINEAFDSDYEALRADFNRTVDTLGATLERVSECSQNIKSGSSELATATLELSGRTEAQAASLERTAAALDQLTATVSQTSESAENAKTVVSAVCDQAEKSDIVIRETITAMSAIEDSSKQISKITGVIEEIAFQTNLLALNAGVEAARAGEAGRGFTVVATEVRALAQRSAEAAKDINDLILTAADHVQNGVRLVDETGSSLETIASKFTEVASLVVDIALSSEEHSAGVSEINGAVNKMDVVTQQNAAMVEQATAACHALSHDAQQMNALMDHFQIGGIVEPGATQPAQAQPSSMPADLKTQQSQVRDYATARRSVSASGAPHAEVLMPVSVGATASKTKQQDWSEF